MELHELLARSSTMVIAVILIARISSCLNTAVLSEVSKPAAKISQDVQLFLDTCIFSVGNI